MRMQKIVLLGLAALIFVSCQKELSLENSNSVPTPPGSGGPGPDTLGDLLVRAVAKYSASDSTVQTYSYDAAKHLIGINTSGTLSGNNLNNKETIKRDASGNITQIVLINAQAGGDTLVTDVFFDAVNNRYSHTIISFSFNGSTYVDSSVLVYDGAGKIIQTVDYAQNPLAGYQLLYRNEYTYSGSAIDSVKLFAVDPNTGSLDWISANIFSYDAKVNPLILSNGDAILLTQPLLYSPNNNILLQSLDVKVPANGFTLTTSFTYNSKNKPITSISTHTPGGATYTGSFYYQ